MNANSTIFEEFRRAALNFSSSPALQEKGEDNAWREISYQKLYEQVVKLSRYLLNSGIKSQERIGIILENGPQWPTAYLGIVSVGATAVPLDPQLTPREILNLLSDSQAKILFTSQKLALNLKEVLKDLPWLKIVEVEAGEFIEELDKIYLDEKLTLPKVESEDIASLLYTSGTTDVPKAVMLTHRNLLSNYQSIGQLNIYSSSDNFISILPLHHSYPFMVNLLMPLLKGAKITYIKNINPQQMQEAMQEKGVSILTGVPQLFSMLHKGIYEKIKELHPLGRIIISLLIEILAFLRRCAKVNISKVILKKLHSRFGKNLRFFISGGARLDVKVARGLYKLGFTILEGYGLTETSPVLTFNPPESPRFGSAGKALPGIEIKISQPNDEGIGEIIARGPNVMKGYFKRPQETREVLKDGWFYTGDLGYLDKQGYLYIRARKKEVIVLASGKNIYPAEIESHYNKSPFIKESCVVLVKKERLKQRVDSLQAVIRPDLEYFQKMGEVNIQDKIRWEVENLSRNIAAYRRIMGYTLTREELPRTRLGKLKRYIIQEKFFKDLSFGGKEGKRFLSPQDRRLLSLPVAIKILSYLSKELNRKIELDDHLELDLGLDSLARAELVIGLEKFLSIQIPEEEIADALTVRDFLSKLDEITSPQTEQETKEDLGGWAAVLKEPPADEIMKKINLKPGLLNKTITLLISKGIYLLFLLLFQLRISGKRNIPGLDKPFIICSNHSSYLDGFIILVSLPLRLALKLYFLGHSGYFEHPLIAWAVRFARLISIDPSVHLVEAMQTSSFVLRNFKILCIFPEGVRSADGKIEEFKTGVGILAKELKVDLVPVYIQGSFKAWPRHRILPLPHPIKLSFGKALEAEEFAKLSYEEITRRLRNKVIELAEIK